MGEKQKVFTLKRFDCFLISPRFFSSRNELETLSRIYRKLVSNCPITSRQLAMNPNSLMANKQSATIEGIDRSVFRELLHSTFDIVTEEALMVSLKFLKT